MHTAKRQIWLYSAEHGAQAQAWHAILTEKHHHRHHTDPSLRLFAGKYSVNRQTIAEVETCHSRFAFDH